MFCKKVFGDEGNFSDDEELEKLGRMITEKCKGLPLSIVTVGGLLAKSQKTTIYWESVFGNLNSIVSENDNEHCLKILSISYSHLPIHLKPCFLYMGLLPEDHNIRVENLITLWIAEGFLKPNKFKSLKEVASDYLKDLIDRNLVLFKEWGPTKKEEVCSMHDLLRDVCLKESHKDKFLFLVKSITNPNIESQRRLVLEAGMEVNITQDVGFVHDLESVSLVRSLTTNGNQIHLPQTHRLLRVLEAERTCLEFEVFEHVNLRYLKFEMLPWTSFRLPSAIDLLWNLETLIIYKPSMENHLILPIEIWGMPQLRNLTLLENGILPQPPSGQSNNHENSLQRVESVRNFKLTEDVIRRIPNVKNLGIECYHEGHQGIISFHDDDDWCVVRNLDCLVKLESLQLWLFRCPHSLADNWQQQINFSISLKVLQLFGGRLPWKCMAKIGSLPHLEEISLWEEAFTGNEWNPVEDNEEQTFPCLKYLEIDSCPLEDWNADDTCFPRLERLVLESMDGLKEIPLDFGNIPTLQLVHVKKCSQGVVNSAREIQEQQQSFCNDTIQIYISDDESDVQDDMSQDEFEGLSDYASTESHNESNDE